MTNEFASPGNENRAGFDYDARVRNYGFTTSSDDLTADNPVNWNGEGNE